MQNGREKSGSLGIPNDPEKDDLIRQAEELHIICVKFDGSLNVVQDTGILFNSLRRMDVENEEIRQFLKS